MKELHRLIEVLGITEDEAMRALISAFASVQPGPFRQKLIGRQGYGTAPSTSEIWQLLSEAEFRCSHCGSHADLTLDHLDRDTLNSRAENLRVLCNSCNRSINSRPVVNKHANLRIYKAIISLIDRLRRFPTAVEIREEAVVTQLSGAYYMIRFFEAKYGAMRPVRAYGRRRAENDEN